MPNLRIVKTGRPVKGWTDSERWEIFRTRKVIQPLFGPLEVEFGETDQGHPWAALAHVNEGTVVAHFARLNDQVIVDFPDLEIMGQGFTLREGLARILTECRHGPDLSGARRLLARIFDPANRPTYGLSIAWFLVAWEVMSTWERRWQATHGAIDEPVGSEHDALAGHGSPFDATQGDVLQAVTRMAATLTATHVTPWAPGEDGHPAPGPVSALTSGKEGLPAPADGDNGAGELDGEKPPELEVSEQTPEDTSSLEQALPEFRAVPPDLPQQEAALPDDLSVAEPVDVSAFVGLRNADNRSVFQGDLTREHNPSYDEIDEPSHDPHPDVVDIDVSHREILHLDAIDADRLQEAGWEFRGLTTDETGAVVSAFVSPTKEKVVLLPFEARDRTTLGTIADNRDIMVDRVHGVDVDSDGAATDTTWREALFDHGVVTSAEIEKVAEFLGSRAEARRAEAPVTEAPVTPLDAMEPRALLGIDLKDHDAADRDALRSFFSDRAQGLEDGPTLTIPDGALTDFQDRQAARDVPLGPVGQDRLSHRGAAEDSSVPDAGILGLANTEAVIQELTALEPMEREDAFDFSGPIQSGWMKSAMRDQVDPDFAALAARLEAGTQGATPLPSALDRFAEASIPDELLDRARSHAMDADMENGIPAFQDAASDFIF